MRRRQCRHHQAGCARGDARQRVQDLLGLGRHARVARRDDEGARATLPGQGSHGVGGEGGAPKPASVAPQGAAHLVGEEVARVPVVAVGDKHHGDGAQLAHRRDTEAQVRHEALEDLVELRPAVTDAAQIE